VLAGEAAEVVDALEDDQIADAGLGEHVAVETGEDVGAEAVREQMVAAGRGRRSSGRCRWW
jgi:hypothetical protein